MTVPLQVLAVGSVLAGLIGIPALIGDIIKIPNWFEHFLHPVFADAHHALEKVHTAAVPGHGVELGLMLASVAIAAAGIIVATRLYQAHPEIPERLAATFATAHRVLTNKYYVDELYGKMFVRGLAIGGGNALFANDRYFVDGGDGEVRPGFGVNGIAWLTRDIVARLSNFWDKWIVDGAVNLLAAILDNLSYLFRSVQNGLVQSYALSAIIGLFFLIAAGRYLLGLY
jgi:NADH-quinone oxidoreductase subunit L